MKNYFTQLLSAMGILALVICSLPLTAASSPQIASPSTLLDANCSTEAGKQLANRLSTLGRQAQNNPLLTVKKSVFKGLPVEYVSSATGNLSFAVTDISFEGNLPLFFQRIYSSDNNEDHGLGRGWNFIFNEKIEANLFEAVLTTASGEKYEFDGEGLVVDKTGNREKFVLRNQEPATTQSFVVYNQKLIKETSSFAEKTYEKYGEAFFLTEIRIPGGEIISLRRTKDGKLTKVSSRTGEIKLKWTNGNLGSVSDKAGRKVFFRQKRIFRKDKISYR